MAIYFVVSGSVFAFAWVIRATLRQLKFEAFDRHLGMLLGGAEGLLLGLVTTIFVVSLAPQTRDPIFQSPSGRLVGGILDSLGPVLPSEVRVVLAPYWSQTEASVSIEKDPQPKGQDPHDGAETDARTDSSRLGDRGSADASP